MSTQKAFLPRPAQEAGTPWIHEEPGMAAQRQSATACLKIYGQGLGGVFTPQIRGGGRRVQL